MCVYDDNNNGSDVVKFSEPNGLLFCRVLRNHNIYLQQQYNIIYPDSRVTTTSTTAAAALSLRARSRRRRRC